MKCLSIRLLVVNAGESKRVMAPQQLLHGRPLLFIATDEKHDISACAALTVAWIFGLPTI